MLDQPSRRRSRLWVPAGLLLTLAGGAWWLLDATGRGESTFPEGGVPRSGLIRPLPAAPPDGVVTPASALAQPGAAELSAEQVLQEVAQRGRQAPAAAPAPSKTVSADALQTQLRRDPAAAHRQSAGQRLRLQGSLASVELGEPGVVVLHLALADEPGTVRAVVSPDLAQAAAAWQPPRAVSLDCLSQGVMMGEWLLADCRQ